MIPANLLYPLLLALLMMAFSAFFAGMEIAFVSSNKVRLEIDNQRGGLISKIVDLFYNHSNDFISALLVGNNIANVVFSMSMATLLTAPFAKLFNGNNALVLITQTILSALILLITSEFIPKAVFRINPNRSLRLLAIPLFVVYCILWPISKFTSLLSVWLMRLFGIKSNPEKIDRLTVEELDAYLQENIERSDDENKEVEREVKIFENALDFSDTRLRDCMIPRNEIVGVDIAETSRDDLVKVFIQSGLSKIVVYHDDVDNPLGFIGVSDMFTPDKNWRDEVKPVLFAPETMLAKEMMQMLLKQKRSMAIVIDEFGGTAGLVTLEDLVEEIFGDIEDEHDRHRLVARMIAEGVYEFSGRCEVDQINEQFHLDLPESDEYQTIAGLVLATTGEIPAEGERISVSPYALTILKKSEAKIELIKVENVGQDND